jgi:hypothetical protein
MKESSFATLLQQGNDEMIVYLCTVSVPVEKVCVQYLYTEPEFLNVYGAQASILRNEFRQPM